MHCDPLYQSRSSRVKTRPGRERVTAHYYSEAARALIAIAIAIALAGVFLLSFSAEDSKMAEHPPEDHEDDDRPEAASAELLCAPSSRDSTQYLAHRVSSKGRRVRRRPDRRIAIGVPLWGAAGVDARNG
jgi:hypothetical protein